MSTRQSPSASPRHKLTLRTGALDSGAHGVIVPLIYTVEDAKKLVSSAKFPPEGTRGFGSPLPTQCFSNEPLTYYLRHANSTLLTIVQIETASALASCREIAALPGVDCLLIGPFDLGNNIGHPILTSTMDKELEEAIESIKEAAHAEGKKVAMYCNSGEDARGYAERGFDMVSILTDQMGITGAFDDLGTSGGGGGGGGNGGGIEGVNLDFMPLGDENDWSLPKEWSGEVDMDGLGAFDM